MKTNRYKKLHKKKRLCSFVCFQLGLISLLLSGKAWSDVRKTKYVGDVFLGVTELGKKYPRSRIGVLFDVDGTITKQGAPERRKKSRAEPRGAIVPLVKSLSEDRIPFYASSAWKNFNESVERIQDTGLGPYFGLGNESQSIEPKSIKVKYTPQVELNDASSDEEEDAQDNLQKQNGPQEKVFAYYRVGSVISVFEGTQFFPGYSLMLGKGLAPYIPFLELQHEQLKQIPTESPFDGMVIADDNGSSLAHTRKTIETYGLFPNTEILYYQLDDPAEDTQLTLPLPK